jgi:hypothetical protein
MHFHLGWLGLSGGLGHGGYYVGDGRYRNIDQQEDRMPPRQENRTVGNAKLDHLISPKTTTTHGQQTKL